MIDSKEPAFPAETTIIPLSHNGGRTYYKGMDLRTYTATKILSGLLSNQHVSNLSNPNDVIILAIGYADRLIKQLNEEIKNE